MISVRSGCRSGCRGRSRHRRSPRGSGSARLSPSAGPGACCRLRAAAKRSRPGCPRPCGSRSTGRASSRSSTCRTRRSPRPRSRYLRVACSASRGMHRRISGVVRPDRVGDDVLVDLVADDLFVGLVDLDDLLDTPMDVVREERLDGCIVIIVVLIRRSSGGSCARRRARP